VQLYLKARKTTDIVDGPQNVAINASRSAVLKDGDSLSCSAVGNPTPVYQWTDATSGRRIHQGLSHQNVVCLSVSVCL